MSDSFQTKKKLSAGGREYSYFSLPDLSQRLGISLSKIPFSTLVLLENLLRNEDGVVVTKTDVEYLAHRKPNDTEEREIQFQPARVLLQDFTGVPVIADLAAVREAVVAKGGAWEKVNPLQQVDLVIDHSVQVDVFARPDAVQENTRIEFERNLERYRFLKWGQQNFKNLRIVPPATGICHQVNMEYLSGGVWVHEREHEKILSPDSVIGTDSHTPMVNSLGVLGWGVGGIEAEAAMLGQPISLLIPPVVGFHLTGKLPAGITATDLVLNVTQILRKKGVVGKFVEFFGEGLTSLAAADRATVSNMAPEYGATVGIFPPDESTLAYFRATGRDEQADLIKAYYQIQGMWGHSSADQYQEVVELDLGSLETSMAGPSKPHERVSLSQVARSFRNLVSTRNQESFKALASAKLQTWVNEGGEVPEVESLLGRSQIRSSQGPSYDLKTGDIVIAAITSCTNTSNQRLMIASGLLAQKAAARGLQRQPWVKTSFAPGSIVVADYMREANLLAPLAKLGFDLVGFGCTTCIGNSGPLPAEISEAIQDKNISTVAVLSGNRNFEARIHPQVIGNYLASPPLVVASAIKGTILTDLRRDPLGMGSDGKPVYLADVWPTEEEISAVEHAFIRKETYRKNYAHVLDGDQNWKDLPSDKSSLYPWEAASLYLQKPPFLDVPWDAKPPSELKARVLAVFGDFVTTDHISPAGSISPSSPAGKFLSEHGVPVTDFNSYGSRRGNHNVMIRGTFANVRIKNQLADREGGYTTLFPEKKQTTIFDAATEYEKRGTPLVVFGGREYGSGSSRDWAAKGTRLLGVRAVIAEGFERIHRSNLIGMGVIPLQLPSGVTTASLGLTGEEEVVLKNLDSTQPRSKVAIEITGPKGTRTIESLCRIDTANELAYYRAGGLLPFMTDKIRRSAASSQGLTTSL